MWVFTIDGFYSAVAHRGQPGMMMVRCRDESDALRLAEWVEARTNVSTPITHDINADYPWRLVMRQSTFGNYVAECAVNVDYDNFKAEVHKQQGFERAHVYTMVWSTLRDTMLPKRRRK